MSTTETTPAHEHAFPVLPPEGSFSEPGPCRQCAKTYDQNEADRMLAMALKRVERAYGVPPRVSEQWCIAWGGEDANDCAGRLEYDDEADARDMTQWIDGGIVARGIVVSLPWEAVPGGGVPCAPEDRPHEEWGGCAGGHCWCGAQHSRDEAEEIQADDEARRRSELGDAWDGETHRGNL